MLATLLRKTWLSPRCNANNPHDEAEPRQHVVVVETPWETYLLHPASQHDRVGGGVHNFLPPDPTYTHNMFGRNSRVTLSSATAAVRPPHRRYLGRNVCGTPRRRRGGRHAASWDCEMLVSPPRCPGGLNDDDEESHHSRLQGSRWGDCLDSMTESDAMFSLQLLMARLGQSDEPETGCASIVALLLPKTAWRSDIIAMFKHTMFISCSQA